MHEFPAMNFTGAIIVAKTEDWRVEERIIVAHDVASGKFTINPPFYYMPKTGVQFYFKGLSWMLDWSDGWVVEKSNNGFQVLRLSKNISKGQSDIYYTVNEPNIKIKGSARISGIRSTFAGDVGLLAESNFLEINDSEFNSSKNDGVKIKNSGVVSIKNSKFFNSGRDAIRVSGGKFVEVVENTIRDTGNIGEITDTVAAINVEEVSSSHIEGNVINNSGYSGIRIRYRSHVKNNVIINSCLWLDDCGAIYSWNRTTPDLSSNLVLEGNKISGVFGREESWRLRTRHRKIAAGIYLDEKTNGVFVLDNDISRVSQGIFMGGSINNYIYHNKFSGYDDCGICVYESREKNNNADFSSIVANKNFFGKTLGAVLSVHGAADDILQPIFSENKTDADTVHWDRRKGGQLDQGYCYIKDNGFIECNIYN